MSDALEIEYKITPGKYVKRITFFVVILFVGLGVGIPASMYMTEGITPGFLITTALTWVLYVTVLAGSWAFSPRSYSVSEKAVTIKRPVRSFAIPMNKITGIEERNFKFGKLRKKMGNGGLFSYTGSFRTREDGTLWFYTKNSNYLMIHADKKYVLSPDDKFMFVNQVRKHLESCGNSNREGDAVRLLVRK